jgi:hypothetical protein
MASRIASPDATGKGTSATTTRRPVRSATNSRVFLQAL